MSERPIPTSASYSVTVRLRTLADPAVVARTATAVAVAGGVVTAIAVVPSVFDSGVAPAVAAVSGAAGRRVR